MLSAVPEIYPGTTVRVRYNAVPLLPAGGQVCGSGTGFPRSAVG